MVSFRYSSCDPNRTRFINDPVHEVTKPKGDFALNSKAVATIVVVWALLGALAAAAMPSTNNGGNTPTSAGGDNPKPTDFDTSVSTPLLGPKPLLVVLMEFSDLPHDAAVTPAYVQNEIFGPKPSMNDYYLETSYGKYWFTDSGHWAWVQAWDDPATPGDESTRAYWNAFSDPTYGGGTFQRWGLKSLDMAGFDFAPLDTNGDGKITFGVECAYLLIDAQVANARGGATRTMPPGLVLDGKTVEGLSAGVSGDSPWIVLYAHELSHESSWGGWFLPDYYAIKPQNIGQFALMGYSAFSNASGGWQTPIGPVQHDPLSKLKEGWYTPTVVATDGFYDIPNAEKNPSAFVLYDPSHGKQEYFMVENRWEGSSYDAWGVVPALTAPLPPADASVGIPDQGLLIWHVDETRDWNGSTTGGYAKIALDRRDGTDNGAAFAGGEAGYYDFWDGSSPANAQWNGGVDSKTGVWCVSGIGDTMRAYLDVPGPGVLICSGAVNGSAVPGSPATYSFPVRNTGDSTDMFTISVTGLDPDLIAIPGSPVTLAPKAEGTGTVTVIPTRACATAPTLRSFTIVAQSTNAPTMTASVQANLQVLSFGDPRPSMAPSSADVTPPGNGTFTVDIVNDGNAVDTMTLSFTGDDFGNTYRAFPTSIPGTWVAFAPLDPSAPACGSTSSILTISVPWDWAGMENATYTFVITATSGIDNTSGTTTGSLTVHATPLSMMLYVKIELQKLLATVEALPPSDVRDGLQSKVMAAINKTNQAFDRYMLGDDPPASNLFGTVQHMLAAFLHQADAQRGKALTDAEWTDLTGQASQIISDLGTIISLI